MSYNGKNNIVVEVKMQLENFQNDILNNLQIILGIDKIELYHGKQDSLAPPLQGIREEDFLHSKYISINEWIVLPFFQQGKIVSYLVFQSLKPIDKEKLLAAANLLALIKEQDERTEKLEKGTEQLIFLNDFYERINKSFTVADTIKKTEGFLKEYFQSSQVALYLKEENNLILKNKVDKKFIFSVNFQHMEEWASNVYTHKAECSWIKNFFFSEEKFSFTTIPIFSQAKFLGLLLFDNVQNSLGNVLTEEKEDFLLNIGYILGSAFEKSFLLQKALDASQLKSLFVANMSHEIRTPLNAIIGFSELLSWEKITDRQREYVSSLQVSSNHLLGLIENILDLSKIELGKMDIFLEEFSLKELTKSLQNLFSYSLQTKGLDFTVNLASDLPEKIITDPKKVKQVLINLLGNALKFTNQGSIKFSIERILQDGKLFLRFTIEDTGVGIPTDKIEYIFENFTQADNSTTKKYGGTGLGLSITKKIIQLLGGQIYVSSEAGKGSKFFFTLPLLNSPSLEATDLDSYKKENVKLLLVEDNEMNRKIIRYMLEQEGYENLEEAINGYEALNKVKNKNYDLILMDVQMPEMDGYTAVKKIREAGLKQVKIVALTAYSTVEDRKKALLVGCDDYLSKPVQKQDLIDKIEKFLGKRIIKRKLDGDIFTSLQQEFCEVVKEKLTQLEKALLENDEQAIKKIGHNLKGSGKMFNYPQITILGEIIENFQSSCDNGEKEQLKIKMEKMISAFSLANCL